MEFYFCAFCAFLRLYQYSAADNHKQLMTWTGKMMRHHLLILMSVLFLIAIGRTSFGHTAAWQPGTKYPSEFCSEPSEFSTDRITAADWRSLIDGDNDDIRAYSNQVIAAAGGLDTYPFYAMEWLDDTRLINGDGRFDHWIYDINFSSFEINGTSLGSINPRANSAGSAPTPGATVFLGFFLIGIGSLGRKRLLKKNG